MNAEQWMVRRFHEKFGREIGLKPGDNFTDERARRLRAALIFEEACEFVAACGYDPREFFDDVQPILGEQRGAVGLVKMPEPGERFGRPAHNFPAAVDAMCDLKYVTDGAGICFGVDLEPLFKAVHHANMAKTGGAEREDGKILKPPGWMPPDIKAALWRQGWKP